MAVVAILLIFYLFSYIFVFVLLLYCVFWVNFYLLINYRVCSLWCESITRLKLVHSVRAIRGVELLHKSELMHVALKLLWAKTLPARPQMTPARGLRQFLCADCNCVNWTRPVVVGYVHPTSLTVEDAFQLSGWCLTTLRRPAVFLRLLSALTDPLWSAAAASTFFRAGRPT